MDFSQQRVSPVKRYGGLGVVVLLHALVAYALITGLARKMVDVIKQPVETKIIEEVKPPPPPDTPPPPPPKMTAPPPPFIPPPEVQIQQPVVQNTITAVTNQQPAHQDFRPAPPPVTGPVAPPGPPTAVLTDLNSCKPDYPRASVLAEEQGTVRITFTVGPDSQLMGASVVKSSGFRNLDKAAVNALSRCKFKAAVRDGKPVQSAVTVDYDWKLE